MHADEKKSRYFYFSPQNFNYPSKRQIKSLPETMVWKLFLDRVEQDYSNSMVPGGLEVVS